MPLILPVCVPRCLAAGQVHRLNPLCDRPPHALQDGEGLVWLPLPLLPPPPLLLLLPLLRLPVLLWLLPLLRRCLSNACNGTVRQSLDAASTQPQPAAATSDPLFVVSQALFPLVAFGIKKLLVAAGGDGMDVIPNGVMPGCVDV